jgi:hypothetical protein
MFDTLYEQFSGRKNIPFPDFAAKDYDDENWLLPPAQVEELPRGLIPDEM